MGESLPVFKLCSLICELMLDRINSVVTKLNNATCKPKMSPFNPFYKGTTE